MVEFGNQIQGVQGDEPGEAVMLDSSGQVPGGNGGSGWTKIHVEFNDDDDQTPWTDFLTAFDNAPEGSFVVISSLHRESTYRYGRFDGVIYKTPRMTVSASALEEEGDYVAIGRMRSFDSYHGTSHYGMAYSASRRESTGSGFEIFGNYLDNYGRALGVVYTYSHLFVNATLYIANE